jgi:hypothetical protein
MFEIVDRTCDTHVEVESGLTSGGFHLDFGLFLFEYCGAEDGLELEVLGDTVLVTLELLSLFTLFLKSLSLHV